jgi:hypothetical protein
MGFGQFLRRADKAVQDTRQSVTGGVFVAVAALVVALVALVVAVVKR